MSLWAVTVKLLQRILTHHRLLYSGPNTNLKLQYIWIWYAFIQNSDSWEQHHRLAAPGNWSYGIYHGSGAGHAGVSVATQHYVKWLFCVTSAYFYISVSFKITQYLIEFNRFICLVFLFIHTYSDLPHSWFFAYLSHFKL